MNALGSKFGCLVPHECSVLGDSLCIPLLHIKDTDDKGIALSLFEGLFYLQKICTFQLFAVLALLL